VNDAPLPYDREYHVLQLYAGNLYGGIETLLVTLAKYRYLFPMIDRYFALCFHGRLRDELLAVGASVYDLGPVHFSRPWTLLRARYRLKRLMKDIPFDAVMTHACWPHAAFAPVVRRSGVRLVHSIHDELSGRNWIERLARRTPPDLMIANSRFSAEHSRSVFPTSPIRVVYHPVAAPSTDDHKERRARVRAAMGTPQDRVVIIQASRPERWKGHGVHIAALARLREEPNWEAWLAGGSQKKGEDSFLAELRAMAEREGIADRVRFLGQRRDVPDLMSAADIYCQPNIGPEPFGLSFVEALSWGLPVVTSNYGGGAEIVTSECGALTAPNDIPAVAEALRGLIRDPALRRAKSEAAPLRAASLCDLRRQIARRAVYMLGAISPKYLCEAAEVAYPVIDIEPQKPS